MPQLLPALLLPAALLLSACTGPGPDRGAAPAAPPALQAPAGQRWVAFRGVAVAVPQDWETEIFDGCGRTPDGAVVFRLPAGRHGCGQGPDRRRSWVLLEPLAPGDDLLLAMGAGGRVDGVPVRETGPSCRNGAACDQAVAVPSLGFLAHVHAHGDGARSQVATIRRSLMPVPDGWTSVPPIPFGTSDEDALALLEESDLEGRIPEVDWPHYVTGSSPPPGAVVEDGSVVDLTIGDG